MKLTLPLLTILLGGGSGAVCAAEPAATPAKASAAPARLSFYHWWTSPSEATALQGLVDLFESRYVGIDVQPLVAGRGTAAVVPVLQKRLEAGDPPEIVFAHGGYSPEPLLRAGLVRPIDDVWSAEKLAAVVPKALQEMSRSGGHYYVVPLGIHRDNVVWYNKPLLARHGIDPGTLTTWEAFFTACRRLRAAGVEAPIELGETWTAAHAFGNMVASQGLDAYEDWANGKITKAGDPRIVAALNVLKEYVGLANPDHVGLAWDAAIQRVAKGEGAFSIMGDWADGVFRQADLAFGKDYGTILIPGTAGMYGTTIDAFARPAGLRPGTPSDQWLAFVASREGQDAFNTRKGSIPPRTDADETRYAPYQQSAIRDFRAAKQLFPGFGTGFPDAVQPKIHEVLAAFVTDLDVKKADAALARVASEASASYTRTWSLR